MENLFYDEPYLKNFYGNIININEQNNLFYVKLDKTYFYYGSGGQRNDKGKIDGINVIDVIEEDGDIVHVLVEKPKNIENVICEIDWNWRFDGMIQHSAQHLLSGIFYNVFNKNTCSAHFGEEISTVDISGNVTEDELIQTENIANNLIFEQREIKMFSPTNEELEKIETRRDLPETNKKIRIVQIENFDTSACSGVHIKNISEIRILKIKKSEKHKGNTRVEFVAGKRAVDYLLSRDRIFDKVCNMLSTGENNLINAVSNLEEKIEELNKRNKFLEDEYLNYKIIELLSKEKKVNDFSIITNITDGADTLLTRKISEAVVNLNGKIILQGYVLNGRLNLIFAISKDVLQINISEILKDTLNKINGKGGGNKFIAQGSGNCSNNDFYALELISYAENKIIRLLRK